MWTELLIISDAEMVGADDGPTEMVLIVATELGLPAEGVTSTELMLEAEAEMVATEEGSMRVLLTVSTELELVTG
jgi:hypothetical protein